METIGTWWMWAGFFAIVLVILAIEPFLVGGSKQHRVSPKEAATWSGIWVGVALAFARALWWYLDAAMGREIANRKALEYVTGYLIETSLAVGNVLVWLILFAFFAGVWLLYVVGAFLLITGIKMWWFADEKPDLATNPVVRWIRGHIKVTDERHGERVFVMKEEAGNGCATDDHVAAAQVDGLPARAFAQAVQRL